METWSFNNSRYTSLPLSRFIACSRNDKCDTTKRVIIKTLNDNNFEIPPLFDEDSDERSVVYVPKYDKCYYLEYYAYCGKGNNLKVYLQDVYNEDSKFFIMAKDVNIVFKIKDE